MEVMCKLPSGRKLLKTTIDDEISSVVFKHFNIKQYYQEVGTLTKKRKAAELLDSGDN